MMLVRVVALQLSSRVNLVLLFHGYIACLASLSFVIGDDVI